VVHCEEGTGVDTMAAERAARMVLKQAEGNEDKEADEVGGRRVDGLDEAEGAHTDVNTTMVREVEEVAGENYKCPVVLEEVLADPGEERCRKVEDKD